VPSNQWASDASARNQLLHLQPRMCAHTPTHTHET
jgi:hypothetical protein